MKQNIEWNEFPLAKLSVSMRIRFVSFHPPLIEILLGSSYVRSFDSGFLDGARWWGTLTVTANRPHTIWCGSEILSIFMYSPISLSAPYHPAAQLSGFEWLNRCTYRWNENLLWIDCTAPEANHFLEKKNLRAFNFPSEIHLFFGIWNFKLKSGEVGWRSMCRRKVPKKKK